MVALSDSVSLPSKLRSTRVANQLMSASFLYSAGRVSVGTIPAPRPLLAKVTPLVELPFWVVMFWSSVVFTANSCRMKPDTAHSAAWADPHSATNAAAAMACR